MEADVTERDEANGLLRSESWTLYAAMPQFGWRAQADGTRGLYDRGWYEHAGATLEAVRDAGWRGDGHGPLP